MTDGTSKLKLGASTSGADEILGANDIGLTSSACGLSPYRLLVWKSCFALASLFSGVEFVLFSIELVLPF